MGAAARPVRAKRPSRRALEAAGGHIPSAPSAKRPGRSVNAQAPSVIGMAEAAAARSASSLSSCRAKRRRRNPSSLPKKTSLLRSHTLTLDPCSNRGGKRQQHEEEEEEPRPPDNSRGEGENNLLDYAVCPPPDNNDDDNNNSNNVIIVCRDLAHNLLGIDSSAPKRPCPPDNNNSDWRDWANVADGPVGLIAERVLAYDVADYVRFRAVCPQWRQCSTEPRSNSGLDRRFHPWRWTMLRDELAVPDRCSFLNASTGECLQVDIPELRDHDMLAVTPEGLLILLQDRKHIRLLNPLTRHLTELPPLTTLVHPTDHRHLLEQNPHFTTCFAAWGSGIVANYDDDGDDGTFVLCFTHLCMLAMAKPGDNHWTVLEYHSNGTTTAPLVFEGRFYCITRNAVKVLVTDPDMPRLELAAKLKNMRVSPMSDSVHLVNNCGELMLVHRHCGPLTAGNKSGRSIDTYQVDLDTGTLIPVKSLGGTGRVLFLGELCSLSISLEGFPSGSICADTVYLSFDIAERQLLRVEGYNLADGSVQLPCSLVSRPHTLVDCLSLTNTVADCS